MTTYRVVQQAKRQMDVYCGEFATLAEASAHADTRPARAPSHKVSDPVNPNRIKLVFDNPPSAGKVSADYVCHRVEDDNGDYLVLAVTA